MEKYEKVKKIGEGSFGKAVLVKSREDGRQYVIKEIGISRMSSKERQESRKEVAVLANMSHPNIVQYKESFEESGCLYIVMDYCEGGDLFKKINSQKGVLFQEEQILDWFVQICLALKHVHDRKILHRDIKSQNIFLTKDGTVQLGDFGIARVLNSTVELARTCIGTPYYLSPEICENKPYNNKSDIWALGCVLYEMCTLRHAFEAGNMKNLVLKIIRGSYPPVSVHYSQDLRSLLAQLFRRNPRERPSINSVLDKLFLSRRIHKYLTPQLIAQEFSHTVLHNQPKASVAQGVPAKRPAPGPVPISPAQKITKPAAKYGVPLTIRKPSDVVRKASDARKPPFAERKPVTKHKQEGVRKKRMELMEKERKQREQMILLKAAQMKRFEKEKLNRINRAREQGWRHVLSSSGGSSPERKFYGGAALKAPSPTPSPVPEPGPVQRQPPSVGQYDHFYFVLDTLGKPDAKEGVPARAVLGAAARVMSNGPAESDPVKVELKRIEQVTKNAQVNRLRGRAAAERACQVEEFLQRKREAMQNKVRAEGQLGARQNLAAVFGRRLNTGRCRRANSANKEEEEYLSRLRQIRLQNFNERQQIKARLRGEKYDSDGSDSQESSEEAELRRKKIEALKAQANARAAVLREQLEKRRREAYEREKKAWEDQIGVRGVKMAGEPPDSVPESEPIQAALPPPKFTVPAISMTAALKDVGALASGQNPPVKDESPQAEASLIQNEKKEILKRLNENLKVQSHEPEKPVESPTPQEDRKQWVAGGPPNISVAQQTLEETCLSSLVETNNEAAQSMSPDERPCSGGDRRKWDVAEPPVLSVAQQTLEETVFTTAEQTSGEVICMEPLHEQGPRKSWEQRPDSQVLKVLEQATLQPVTQLLNNSSTLEKTVTDSLKSSPGPSSEVDGLELPHQSQPNPPADVPLEELDMDEALVSELDEPALLSEETAMSSKETETEVPDDLESVVLEESCPLSENPPAGVVQAWCSDANQPRPPEGDVAPETSREEPEEEEKQPESSAMFPGEDPMFIKLPSPAHRRTAVLSRFLAQSSVEDSSSSVASRSRSTSPLRSKQQDSLLIGLSTGLFDANNPQMLRTCSLPDLSKLFRRAQGDPVQSNEAAVPENNLEIEDLEDDGKGEEPSEIEDVYEDDDLRELRASMERLLHDECSDEEDDGASNDSPADGPKPGLNESPGEDEGGLNGLGGEGAETSNGSPEEEPVTNGLSEEDEEEHPNTERQLNEEWHSDSSEEEEESDAEQHDSIFSRLEELRFHLEQEMGFEAFIEAYNKIKAIHEDEDENIEMGSNMVQNILGAEHQHLYPKILHLVMADGAYQEDNDE
ncbi:serine/threonine-protein kinase Nek1 isoform X2 [Denticeps clupeoides]|uniref:serine/threonine-protein kinase Nek1 isoform X2 n=1 Tax=Denticeps clupeoides TaxID=299321 RepID=UPI0010A3EE03|nr:serine/threonine-protein kinase Nek1 isoform X2 [Denticeps clupeoides]